MAFGPPLPSSGLGNISNVFGAPNSSGGFGGAPRGTGIYAGGPGPSGFGVGAPPTDFSGGFLGLTPPMRHGPVMGTNPSQPAFGSGAPMRHGPVAVPQLHASGLPNQPPTGINPQLWASVLQHLQRSNFGGAPMQAQPYSRFNEDWAFR